MEQRISEFIKFKMETRAEEKQEGGKKLVLRGYPIVFNVETKTYDWFYGEIKEIILPTALDNTDLSDFYLITGHNPQPEKVLGRAGINMRAEVDETGLFIEVELPNTQLARDIYNLVEAGLVDGMSFGFYCGDQINEETKVRTITSIDKLIEVTITPFPAYEEASIVARNEHKVEELKKEEDNKQAELDKLREEEIKKLEESLND